MRLYCVHYWWRRFGAPKNDLSNFACKQSAAVGGCSSSLTGVNMSMTAATGGCRGGNRLQLEHSSYLVQHANNPVDWYPWGAEAFDRARAEDKLIFLSVGYSTCHWCHVMARESFANEAIACIMNDHFINVKVDREERPDVDRIYMDYVNRVTGTGGWPMSVFLTPALQPVFGGTYFPPDDRILSVGSGRSRTVPGFRSLLLAISERWRTKRETIAALQSTGESLLDVSVGTSATTGAAATGSTATLTTIQVPSLNACTKFTQQMQRSFDEKWGGFGEAPKFPQPALLNALLHVSRLTMQIGSGVEREQCVTMCLRTLECMARGGIRDHLGGGFCRYSVDRYWRVPHFEKMLYDQAQLAQAYLDAYVLTKRPLFERVLRHIVHYVTVELRHNMGGYMGAQDADSVPPGSDDAHQAKVEGAFYVWSYNEVYGVLAPQCGVEAARRFCDVYQLEVNGGKELVLWKGSDDEPVIDDDETDAELERCRQLLLEHRQRTRTSPSTDTKLVTAWNGLIMSALARAGFALKQDEWVQQAVQCATFVRQHLYEARNKRLGRCGYARDRDHIVEVVPGDDGIDAFLEDYAFLIRGLLDVYEATLDGAWLEWAEELQEQQDRLMWDPKEWGYYISASPDMCGTTVSSTHLSGLRRIKDDQDGAEPCGNSVSVHNLIRLAAYLERPDLRDKAGRTLTSYRRHLELVPIALPEMVSALLFYHKAPTQVFIAGEREDDNTVALLDVVRTHYIPGRMLAVADGPGGRSDLLYQRHGTMAKLKRIGGKSAAYVCRNFTCSLPVTEPNQLNDFFEINEEECLGLQAQPPN